MQPAFYRLLLVVTVYLLLWLAVGYQRNVRRLPAAAQATYRLSYLLLANFVCYTFSRGVHLQFFVWISFSLPFLCFEYVSVIVVVFLAFRAE